MGANHCDLLMRIMVKASEESQDAGSGKHAGESFDDQFWDYIEITKFSFGGPNLGGGPKSKHKKAHKQPSVTEVRDKKGNLTGVKYGEAPEEDAHQNRDNFSFNVSKDYDQESPTLLQSYAQNLGNNPECFEKVVVIFRIITGAKADEKLVVLKLTFFDVWVVNYSLDVDSETSVPEEDIEFVFKKAAMQYTPQTETGDKGKPQSPAGWDFFNAKEFSP